MNKTHQLHQLSDQKIKQFLKKVPKCELHIHIEGTLQPELLFKLAKRNKIQTKFNTIQQLKKAYEFENLQQFLDLYYKGTQVLKTQQDFYDLAIAYFVKCKQDNVTHTQIFVDPQTHFQNGIPMQTIMNGIHRAMEYAQNQWGISSYLIPCFLRHLNESSAFQMYEKALQYKHLITGFGLDSSQVNNLPQKFARVFEKVRTDGFKVVAHAGEEGSAEYVWQALLTLKAKRVDHGIRCLEDEKLIEYLSAYKTPLTVCPLSNLKLKVVKKLQDHPLKVMMSKGLHVTINSDDPAYFGGYVNQNYFQTIKALKLTEKEVIQIAKNSFIASFLPQKKIFEYLQKLDKMHI